MAGVQDIEGAVDRDDAFAAGSKRGSERAKRRPQCQRRVSWSPSSSSAVSVAVPNLPTTTLAASFASATAAA